MQTAFDDRFEWKLKVDAACALDGRRTQIVGLIFTEAVMNALRRGFPSDKRGKIETRSRESGDRIELTITNEGVAFSPFASERGRGVGFMRDLARNLGGELEVWRLPSGARCA